MGPKAPPLRRYNKTAVNQPIVAYSLFICRILVKAILLRERFGWEPWPAFTLIYTRFRRRPGVFFVSSIFYQLRAVRICLLPPATLPGIGSYTHRSPAVTPHSLFFRTTDIKLKCHGGILLMAICLLFRPPVAHPCWTRVSLGLTSRITNKLDVGCPSGARTQDNLINGAECQD